MQTVPFRPQHRTSRPSVPSGAASPTDVGTTSTAGTRRRAIKPPALSLVSNAIKPASVRVQRMPTLRMRNATAV